MERRNNNYNNQMNRRQMQYQEIEDLDEITETPKPKFYQNAYSNINKDNNNNNINNIRRQNNKMNLNSNIKTNINNMNNMNLNRNITNNKVNNNFDINNNNINKALILLKNEFKKKDDRIKFLELKVAELERKINMITKSYGNANMGSAPQKSKLLNENNNLNVNLKKDFTFGEQNSGEVNPFKNPLGTNKMDAGGGNYRIINNKNIFPQTNSSNQFKVNNRENSLTGNSGNSKSHSKSDVKMYLKEVKQKVEPSIFKEFIKNIKLLTSSKDKNGVDRSRVVENVRILFGEEYKELFIKFESIIGIND